MSPTLYYLLDAIKHLQHILTQQNYKV